MEQFDFIAGIAAYGPVPDQRQLRHIRKFRKKAFFHFGVNTFTDLEWGDGIEAENVFAPSQLDTRQWIKAIAQAGFELAIITAKHHDGFCLWDSKYTEHCVRNSPYGGDVVKEFAEACREYGLGVGVYISPWDRNAPFWGTDKYSEYYAKQLEELMTGYGHIDEVWWDGAGSAETPYDWKRWNDIIRLHQPDACIFGSMGATDYVDFRWVGNEAGYAGRTHYATIDPEYLLHETPKELNRGAIITPEEIKRGDSPKRYIPAEVDVSVRPGWFYHAHQDGDVKSVKRLAQIWFDSVGSNAFMLLNFPPDRRGLVFDTDARNARLASDFIKSTFAVNLAYGAEVTASNVLGNGYEADKLLQPFDGCFYAASEKNTEIIVTMPESVTFDCYSLSEVVELGERVTEHSLWYLDESGEWIKICENTSVGMMRAEHFDPVTACAVKLIISAHEPVALRSFGLHKMPFDLFKADADVSSSENILAKPSARVEISEDKKILFAEFGGVYPFNTVKVTCDNVSSLNLYAFDGQNYRKIWHERLPERELVISLPETVDGVYRIKIELNAPSADALRPEVYLLG
ncbi:MAG: alpha-L-fucosidase [Clostridia bacterium]|nr:alpha-L-fucosidase [Clostridia bacterium]